MKKIIFKSISVLLVIILAFTVCVTAFAEGEEAERQRDCPHIDVHGFMSQNVYIDPDDPDSDTAWPLSTNAILKAVAKLVFPITKLAKSGDWNAFADDLVPVAEELFEPVCADYNGEITNGSGIRFEYPEADEIEKGSYLQFAYDWRVDPIAVAAQLNDFIDYVLDASDCEQVNLSCHSLGGVITLTYLTVYGSEKVKGVVFNTAAIYGESYTGDLLSGKIDINDIAVKSYLDYAFDGISVDSLLSMLVGLLTDAGVIKYVSDYANDIVDTIYDQIVMSLLKIFGNWTTIWAMVPDEMLAEAEAYSFDKVYDENGVDYSGLKEKIDNYNNTVRSHKSQTLLNLNKSINIYVLSRYAYSSLPMTPSWEKMSDGVVDTKNNSFGATTADFNKTLDVPESEYLSPDKRVDASTCLFPEQTWFIKNIKHSDMADCIEVLMEDLLYYDGQATVDTFPEYPRFMVYDSENGVLLPDTGIVEVTFFDKFIAILEKILKLVISFVL